jgi:putative membrane protein
MMFGYGFDNTFGYLGWFGMFLMMLIPVAIIVGIIYLVYKALDKGTDRVRLGGEVQDPLTILKSRYAKGEISREEFEQVRQDLIREEKNAG